MWIWNIWKSTTQFIRFVVLVTDWKCHNQICFTLFTITELCVAHTDTHSVFAMLKAHIAVFSIPFCLCVAEMVSVTNRLFVGANLNQLFCMPLLCAKPLVWVCMLSVRKVFYIASNNCVVVRIVCTFVHFSILQLSISVKLLLLLVNSKIVRLKQRHFFLCISSCLIWFFWEKNRLTIEKNVSEFFSAVSNVTDSRRCLRKPLSVCVPVCVRCALFSFA